MSGTVLCDPPLTYTEELENAKLACAQHTPNIVQVEEVFIPEKPVRPIPLVCTALSGMVGIMIAIGIIFFGEALSDNSFFTEEPVQAVRKKKVNKPVHEGKEKGSYRESSVNLQFQTIYFLKAETRIIRVSALVSPYDFEVIDSFTFAFG